MKKILLLLIVISSVYSCKDDYVLNKGEGGTTIVEAPIVFQVNDLVVSSVAEDDFSVSLGYVPEDGITYTATLYYCNSTDNVGCNPKLGSSTALTVNTSSVYGDVKNLVTPNDPNDVLNLFIEIFEGATVKGTKIGLVTLEDSPTMDINLVGNGNDGEIDESADTYYIDGEGSEQLYMGQWNLGAGRLPTWGFFRFQLHKDIPSNATVKSVHFNVYGVGILNWNINSHYLNVYIQDVDNTTQPSGPDDFLGGSNGNIAGNSIVRWPSTGGLSWNVDGNNRSPNIAPLIQELVTKYDGLRANDYITVWISSPDFGSNSEVMAADTGHANFDTSLEVVWEY